MSLLSSDSDKFGGGLFLISAETLKTLQTSSATTLERGGGCTWWPLQVGGIIQPLPIISLTSRSCCRCPLSSGGCWRGQEDLSTAPPLCPSWVPQSGRGLQVTSDSQDWRSEKWLQINDGINDLNPLPFYDVNLKIIVFRSPLLRPILLW